MHWALARLIGDQAIFPRARKIIFTGESSLLRAR
jgi:hypothetical protein